MPVSGVMLPGRRAVLNQDALLVLEFELSVYIQVLRFVDTRGVGKDKPARTWVVGWPMREAPGGDELTQMPVLERVGDGLTAWLVMGPGTVFKVSVE